MNEYPGRFLDLLARTTGPILDCGSGGRHHPAVVSLELVAHPNNTVQADALALPFATGTFDLVLSQAVVEHVTEPHTYADEIIRVLRPGGTVYIEGAFLQPVHQAPHHYFNVTPFGLAHLFRRLDILDQGTVGSFDDMAAWIFAEAGQPPPPPAGPLTAAQAWNTASGAYLLGRKP